MTITFPSQENYLNKLQIEQIETLKSTVAKDCTDTDLNLFLYVCARTGLDPFMKQIYAICRKNKQRDGSYKYVMTIQTSIDGFRLISERTGKYSPGREPSYTYDAQGKLTYATAYIKKQTADGSWHEVAATAFWAEYVQLDYNKNPTPFWQKMPHGQLAKCAEALAHRKAFPGDFNQVYSHEEMEQAKNDNKDIVQEAQVEKIPEAEPIRITQIDPNMLEDYLDKNWASDKEKFREFMHEMMNIKGWDLKICISTFNQFPEHAKKTFDGWMLSKLGM